MIALHFIPVLAAAASNNETLFMMIASGAGVAVLAFLVLSLLFPRSKQKSEDDEFVEENGIFGSLTPGLANVIPENEKENREFRQLLRQAGFYSFSARNSIYAARLVLFLLPIFIGMYMGVLFPDLMLQYTCIGLFVGTGLSIIPRLYVYWVRKKRIEHIRAGIPDTMDMFAMCASGGMTMNESLEHIADQIYEYPELSQELCILRRQIELGSLEQAIKDLMERVNIPEMRQFSYLLLRSSQLGNQSNTALIEQADHLRAMRRHHAMAQANKTPTKLVFPLMFCFAPGALILMLSPSLMTIYDFMSSKTIQPNAIQNAIEANSPLVDINSPNLSGNTAPQE
ncbi:MAG: type II secretion system F family protein [Thermoguttaceae bacterium]|nr:type II secretion system F family protein [Thermoguttaceae bacterium]